MADKQERESISVSLPKAMVAKLREEADSRIVSPSLLVEKAVGEYLPKLPSLNIDTSGD